MKKIRFQRGLSLLEILIAMVLLSTVMMAFAMVFPSGYRLTLRNDNEAKAVKLAQAIIGEITNLPFRAPGDDFGAPGSTIRSLYDLQYYWSFNQPYNFPVTANADGSSVISPTSFFRLNNGTSTNFTSNNPKGILVQLNSDQSLASIKVTIVWDESGKKTMIRKQATFYTMRAKNH
jgi:prepilin-type N-terminal cleavage/methylation domain-containing protein